MEPVGKNTDWFRADCVLMIILGKTKVDNSGEHD
jgi:hypothetical protein